LSYKVLKPTICINLINFDIIPDVDKVHTCFFIREMKNPQLILTDHLVIHFLELTKFLKISGFASQFERWMGFFKYEEQVEDIMEIIIKDDPVLQKAHNRYKQFTQNSERMELYEGRMKWQLQYNTDIKYAKEQGIELEKWIVAEKRLADGIAIERVAQYTGLIIAAQTLEVDAITGATGSSYTILHAIANALQKGL